jgi:phosphatidylserine/phosphatidylglycerophosphate/cardiolipin synthase-like enzyme
MRKHLIALFAVLLLAGAAAAAEVHEPALAPGACPLCAPIEVFFSPNGGITSVIVREIGNAKFSIHVQAYGFTSAPIAGALAAASARGVQVHIILDRSNMTNRYSAADYFRNHGITPLIDSMHAIAHNKIMIFDGQTVLTGSFNFTQAAEHSNAENIVILRDKGIAAKYLANWTMHAGHSVPYAGRE